MSPASDTTSTTSITSWFVGRLPAEWTVASPPAIEVDRDEITITITIAAPTTSGDPSELDVGEATIGRIAGFRDDTRERRMAIAREAEHRFERKVSWAVACGERTELFTNVAAPVMTRLRQPERRVLDTLVEANIARSRADALAWCVRLVGKNADEWLSELRGALRSVEEIRSTGPDVS
jgi:hypothetical protein